MFLTLKALILSRSDLQVFNLASIELTREKNLSSFTPKKCSALKILNLKGP